MSKPSIVEKVTEMVLPITELKGFELVDVEYVKEGSNWYIRIYIDKDGGIRIEDCELVSREISDLLDENDPIPTSYILEVSSPGLERPLKKDSDFEKYKGEPIEVRLYNAFENKNKYEGELVGLRDGNIIININGREFVFERKNVALVKKIFKF